MTRRERLILVFVACVTGLVVLLQVTRPEPLTWQQRFNRMGRQPFDVSVLQSYLQDVRGQVVNSVDSSFYELRSMQHQPTSSSWLAITNWLEMDSLSRSALRSFLNSGGTAFIAATELDEDLADEFGLEMEDVVSISDLVSIETANQLPYARIIAYDTANSSVVATVDNTSVVCIRQRLGQGTLVFCSAPLYLTNYALLHAQLRIPSWAIVNAIPRGRIAFDEQYIPYPVKRDGPLRTLLADQAFRWAYWLCGIAAVLGVVVYGRRRQRAIPVIKPLHNASKEFALTVSSLYYNRHNNADLVHKLERLFTDHCKSHRGINPELKHAISSMFESVRERRTVSDTELVALHQQLTTLFATGKS
ncbi:hypothetical protein BH10BAC6_BH10BAC6_12010 [soil metagenome]